MAHETLFWIAIVWITVLLGVCLVLVITGPSVLVRVLAFDVASLMVVATLVLIAQERRSPHWMDAALILALLSFVGTIAAARYQSEGKIFS